MRHYGFEPPWEGANPHLGGWKKGEELWDGSGFVWYWTRYGGAGATLAVVANILRNFYLTPMQHQLSQESVFVKALEAERQELQPTPGIVSSRWQRLKGWLRR